MEGAKTYMEGSGRPRATKLYEGTGAGQRNLDLVYQEGNTFVIVEAKGPKASLTARQIPGVNQGGQQAYCMQGSRRYLDETLRDMANNPNNPAGQQIAAQIQAALLNDPSRVRYISVATRETSQGVSYFSVKQFVL